MTLNRNVKIISNLFLLILIFLYFLFFRINSFNTPFERDEGAYAYIATLMKDGKMPYVDVFDHKPPLIYYTFYVAQLLSADALWPSRVLALFYLVITTLVFTVFVKRELGKVASNFFVLIFPPMMSLPFLTPYSANTEVFMLFPIAISFLIYSYKKKSAGFLSWFFYGVFTAVAVFYKPIAIAPLLYVFTVWIYQTYNRTKRITVLVNKIFLTFLGMFVVSFFIFLPFAIKDGGETFYEMVIQYNSYYMSNSNPVTLPVVLFKLFQAWPIMLLILSLYIVLKPARWRFYVGLIVISSFTVAKAVSGHYFILLVPFLALMASQIGALALTKLTQYLEYKKINKYAFEMSIYMLFFVNFAIPASIVVGKSPETLNILFYGVNEPFNASVVVGKQLTRITKPQDKVFVAGSEPQILYYAKRFSPGRFIYSYPLVVNSPLREKYQNEVIESLLTEKPEIIVYTPLNTSWINKDGYIPYEYISRLNDMINAEYKLVGGYVDEALIGSWKDSLSDSEEKNASFLVYQRI